MPDSYAVLWREPGGATCAGQLSLQRDRLRLAGSSRQGTRLARELLLSEIALVHVGRGAAERIDGRASLVVETSSGERVLVTSATGIGLNHEIADRVGRLLDTIPA